MQSPTLVDKVIEILEDKPLCDSCLGRMFASLMRGFTNEERGKSLKRAAVMALVSRIEEGDTGAREKLEKISHSLGPEFEETLKHYGIRANPRECWVCGGMIEDWVRLGASAAARLRELKAESFVVGVKVPQEILLREDELWRKHGITTGESLKNELKRRVGKAIVKETGVQPDFTEPGVLVLLDLNKNKVTVKNNPLLIKGRYLKKGRNIAQSRWVTWEGERRYDLSVEEMVEKINEYYGGERVVLHASGREDTDARMLGNGRPMVIEVKGPSTRRVPARLLESLLNRRNRWGEFIIEGKAQRKTVREIKTMDRLKRKVYRMLIYSEDPLDEEDVRKLEEVFRYRIVDQRTPTRVLRRRPDIVRKKTVEKVRAKLVSEHLMEALVLCEGGLYVKELVSGDDGRTEPSFSQILGKSLECVELDVLRVID